jgi:cytochrome c-type biogenesis protein CcmH/NrfG
MPASTSRATQLFNAERYEEAAEIYTRMLHKNPNDRRALSNLGLIAFKQGRYADAAGFYRSVVNLAANDPQAFFDLGVAYSAQKNERSRY